MEQSQGAGCLPVEYVAGHCEGLEGGDARQGAAPVGIFMPSGVEAMVCAEIAARQARGIAKYGTTVADNPLTLLEWMWHEYEEQLDAAVYKRRQIVELEKICREGGWLK